ncbi:hypothetical protein COL92_30390 [Bacillus wiedmannii]|nr:hypothetical protein COL92_30390 [Bacillus wiedmannii]
MSLFFEKLKEFIHETVINLVGINIKAKKLHGIEKIIFLYKSIVDGDMINSIQELNRGKSYVSVSDMKKKIICIKRKSYPKKY